MKKLLTLLSFLIFLWPVFSEAVPQLAYKLKPTIIREVRFWWGLDQGTAVFFAQIHQESEWNPDARSPVGAQGLSQFMPSTSAWISKIYPKELGNNKPFDPKWAIRALVTYDKWIYDRIKSKEPWPMTLSSYNGGLGWLYKDQKLTKEKDGDETLWFDNIEYHSNRSLSAFKENRNYVRKIWKVLKPIYEKLGF